MQDEVVVSLPERDWVGRVAGGLLDGSADHLVVGGGVDAGGGNVRVAEAPSFGKPALIYDLKCAGSQAYLRLAREVVKRERQRLKLAARTPEETEKVSWLNDKEVWAAACRR